MQCRQGLHEGDSSRNHHLSFKVIAQKDDGAEGENKGKRASIFYQLVVILSIHLISGCRITASIPAFQAGDGGSTPLSRSNGMNLTNSAQQRHRILCIFWFLSRVKGCHGLGSPVVSVHYFDRVIEKLMRQLLTRQRIPES